MFDPPDPKRRSQDAACGLSRRGLVQASAGAALAVGAAGSVAAAPAAVTVRRDQGGLGVDGFVYRWRHDAATDRFQLRDSHDRLIASGPMQPAVVVAPGGQAGERLCTPGKAAPPEVSGDRVVFRYAGVNGGATLAIAWRFTALGMFTERPVYVAAGDEAVVSLHYFATVEADRPQPAFAANYLVVPGALSGSSVSPILRDAVHLDQSLWIGRGSFIPGLAQQWGLPVHYFAGFSIDAAHAQRGMFKEGRSGAFACGLADLPAGDLFLQLHEGASSVWVDYRGDLWGHMRGPGPQTLGATLHWAFAPEPYDAIAAYYEGLVQAGIVRRHTASAKKTAVTLAPQFCTWGVQVARDRMGRKVDEAFLEGVYAELKASGMKPGLISIDDKWEGSYGALVHSPERFPHFEAFLDRIRADGHKIGLWAAIMRCETPADLGLTLDHVLKRPDGTPYRTLFVGSQYYILDFTQPVVERVLVKLARAFVRRYKPDLLKFDFGYELPTVGQAAPADRAWAGERLLWKGLDIVIKAMREENPDLVVMYYNLSPLFLDYIDLHSPDDLYMASGEYELEANRRFWFSSLMGPLGIPTYGSSGYDWASATSIWFDSTAVGTLGSLNDFQRDEQGLAVQPHLVARYNGLSRVLRPTATFRIVPLGVPSEAPSRGAHARSWARFEAERLVLYAYRPPEPDYDGPLVPPVTDPRIAGVLESPVAVVVASRTTDAIDRAGELALVPLASGRIALRRATGRTARVIHHFVGATSAGEAPIDGGRLVIDARVTDAAGRPLEWIEVQVA